MYYVIQEKVFKEIHYDRILDAVKRLGLDYEVVCLHRADFVPSKTSRKDVFCFGSIKLARLAVQRNWTPGSLMNKNHDYEVYAAHWNEHLLNADSVVQAFEAPITFKGKRFIRPTKDSKLFTGKVFSREDWLMTQEQLLDTRNVTGAMIQIASPKTIYQEIRCWVVDKKVITASTYKVGPYVRFTEYLDEDGLQFSAAMAAIFQPADAFVLDICLSDAGWKIVEVNCINSAGFYASNLQKLLIALEDFYLVT